MIEVKNLTKRYGSNLALNHIHFSLEEGTILGFLGPNGAGKSTTKMCIRDSPYREVHHQRAAG